MGCFETKEFLKLVGIALLIASPIARFAMHSWLEGFAYRTSIAWWVFPLAAGAAILIIISVFSYG